MARPLRRVLIGLSVRLKISIREVESWDIPTIREYMAYLMKQEEPEKPANQTPEEIAATFAAAFARKK